MSTVSNIDFSEFTGMSEALTVTQQRQLPVVEIFGPTIQGEGILVGVPTVFVRLGGCDYHCSWCDTLYAVEADKYKHTWEKMTPDQICARVLDLAGGKPILVTISGGNPALHDLTELIGRFHIAQCKIALETQASVPRKWFQNIDYLTLSPKGPSSGRITPVSKVMSCVDDAYGGAVDLCFKIVVFEEADYEYARTIYEDVFVPLSQDCSMWDGSYSFVLQVGTENPTKNPTISEAEALSWHRHDLLLGYLDLINRVNKDQWRVRVLPQVHSLIWGNKRGV